MLQLFGSYLYTYLELDDLSLMFVNSVKTVSSFIFSNSFVVVSRIRSKFGISYSASSFNFFLFFLVPYIPILNNLTIKIAIGQVNAIGSKSIVVVGLISAIIKRINPNVNMSSVFENIESIFVELNCFLY